MAFNQIVFFGDSLTDNGNLSALVSEPGEPVPPAPYVDGVFSNGPVYSDTLVDLLGVESQNFALVSARAIESRPINDYLAGLGLETPADVDGFDINLNAQVDRFVDENTGEDLSDTAAAILIGANDRGGPGGGRRRHADLLQSPPRHLFPGNRFCRPKRAALCGSGSERGEHSGG